MLIPLKREYLHDYEREEYEHIDKFLKNISEGKFGKNDIFPSRDRFKKLKFPITYRGDMAVPIWSLATFSGSTIIPLLPIEKEKFESFHNFRISDIEQIVSFTEETGKIQFVLMRKPTDYYKLDFLEPIFKRLRPPQFIGFQVGEFGEHTELCKYYAEFTKLANSGLRKYAKKQSGEYSNKLSFDTYMLNLRGNYMMIRAISSKDLSEDFAQIIQDDYEIGVKLMNLLNIMVLRPIRNPLRAIDAYPLETIKIVQKFKAIQSSVKPKVFPYEIGRLLMKKITCYPESLDACKYICGRYEDEKVTKLFQAINEGIIANNPDFVEKNEKDLSLAIDNVWNNQGLENKVNGIKFGIPLALGAIGTIAGSLSGNYEGLLASLGFDAVDRLFGLRGDGLSEKISKFISPSYQTIIFDFKKNYHLN